MTYRPKEEALTSKERQESISMMRINHSGEICAQALYRGQALLAKTPQQHQLLMQAASEEEQHLQWCKERLDDLNGEVSKLNPIWYAGSYAIGALAGLAGDKVSMGFLAETEHQVTRHIEKHLARMSPKDSKSRAVLEQMRLDEMKHATTAENNGAIDLPTPIKMLMKATSKIMTFAASKI